MNAVRIDAASSEHLPEIAELAAIVWRSHYPGIISHEQINYMLQQMYDLRVLLDELTSGIIFERALLKGVLRGFSSFGPGPITGEMRLHKLYVHPQWQRCGIGRALLNHFEQAAVARDARTLILNVNKQNERAIAAYRKHGFTIRESVVVDIGGGFVMDDYVMVKTIA